MNIINSLVFIFSGISLFCFAEPQRTIPPHLYEEFTMNGAVPVQYIFRDDSRSEPLIYTKNLIDTYIAKAKKREMYYYGSTDLFLYQALDNFIDHIQGKEVAVMGSITPWYEAILLAYGAHPVTIEYNKITSEDPRLETITVEEFEKNPRQFDAILSISSFEHDGLGRYGDPINPNGDIEAMQKAKSMLKENGLLFLAIPVGKDCVIWNLHRVYGDQRLGVLLQDWTVLANYGFKTSDLQLVNVDLQPVFVLMPK